MYLDYSKLEFDRYGNPEMPELVLQTLGGKVIGTIPGVHNLKLNIKYSEPSEISFDVPAKIDGEENPIYKDISGYKLIYTKCYGVYEIISPKTESDGASETKHVTGYSYEKTLESKKFFLEEGTFNFWNPVASTDTVLGRLLEIAVGWSAGYVSPSLIGRYRTFDSYDDYLLSFIYNKAPEKYRCVFVFDTYGRTINVYDADEEITNLPIYLDFDNLLESVDITEKSDELVTAIRPYGADELDIRAVNPIGTNWIYDLSYFISNGDISGALAEKWTSWQRSILNQQMYYKGLVSLQASSNARLLSEEAKLTDLNGELDSLISQQSVTIQAIAMETTDEGKEKQQEVLDTINANISAKRAEISSQEAVIAELKRDSESYSAEIQAVVNELSIQKYFSDSEYKELSNYLIEQDITEETFVASSVDTSVSGSSYTAAGASVSITGSTISMVDLQSKFSKKMYVMSGGTFAISEGSTVSGDIIRGTLETKTDGNFVMSFYAGTIRVGDKTSESGVITISGVYSGLSSNVSEVTVDEVTTYEGTTLRFNISSGSMFLTANISEYQKYSVQMELFDYAVGVLSDLATPTYEFEVDSGNFLFAQEFEPFRNELELGKGVYLSIGSSVITPYIIEIELDFEKRNNFSLVFSNRFKRPDETNTLKDMIETSYSSSRSFDASKYIYNQTAQQASAVSEFMQGSLDAAVNTIIGAANQSVLINGSGLHIGGDSDYQLRIVDSMIAMTDDGWNTAKLAIGHFASPEVGEYWGVNAEVIGGKLIIGNSLILENAQVDENGAPTGVMQFRVDATGAWLNNATFVLQKDNGGRMILDPAYGLLAGTSMLFDTNGTTVIPSFIDSDGDLILDNDGMPENTNFFLDIRDGSAYFRGNVYATDGYFNGVVQAKDFLDSNGNSMLDESGKILSDYLDIDDAIKREITATADGISLSVSEPIVDGGQSYVEIALTVNGVTQKGVVKIDGNVDISGQMSADALYAALGEVADLSVDKLSTSRRIVKYLAGNQSDDNYIRIQEQYLEFVAGVYAGGTEQATNPNGGLIYWEADPEGATIGSDGYPYVNGERIFTTTTETSWPVMVYTYTDQVKRSISFEQVGQYYTPVDTFGVGDQAGNRIGHLIKSDTGLTLSYKAADGSEIALIFNDTGYTDITGLRKTTSLDFTGWDAGGFTEAVDGDLTNNYRVEFDAEGRPVKITDSDGHETAITW